LECPLLECLHSFAFNVPSKQVGGRLSSGRTTQPSKRPEQTSHHNVNLFSFLINKFVS